MSKQQSRYDLKSYNPKLQSVLEDDLAITEAILDYYDRPHSARSIRAFLHQHPFGSYITEIADCLCQHGIETTLVTAHPELFTSKVWESISADFRAEKSRTSSLTEVTRVIKKGVLLQHRVPTISLIETELEKRQPVIINCDLRFLQNETDVDLSFAIIVAADDETFSITDSLLGDRIKKYPKKTVLYAITENMSRHPTAGSILLTREHAG